MSEPWPYWSAKCSACGWEGELCEAEYWDGRVSCPDCGQCPLEME